LKKFLYLSSNEIVETSDIDESQPDVNDGLDKALATYRKLTEGGKDADPLTEQQEASLVKRLAEIESRDVIETDEEHEPVEWPCEKGKVTIGPPTLTRFEKARIMGARALQLSLGAPPFVPIPKNARISLDIAMEELEQRVIPITIRRVLPNGDYQNIPIDYFD
jgi:DNA-directed RNA polymerase I, II, and III subunit RPABC2